MRLISNIADTSLNATKDMASHKRAVSWTLLWNEMAVSPEQELAAAASWLEALHSIHNQKCIYLAFHRHF